MTARPLCIGILEAGGPPDELLHHGSYAQMIERWLGLDSATVQQFAAMDGRLPETPNAADVWLITGSKFAAYDTDPWIQKLEGFIRACRDARRPMVGICFGHQLIAKALGGLVQKSANGWGVGVQSYNVTDWPEALGPPPPNFRLQAFHQDQVTRPPQGAKTIVASDFCAHAAIWYPGFALTVQAHPEFRADYARDLIGVRAKGVLGSKDVQTGLAHVDDPTDATAIAGIVQGWIAALPR